MGPTHRIVASAGAAPRPANVLFATTKTAHQDRTDATAIAAALRLGQDVFCADVCFTPTELVLMEDLGFSERGEGWKDVQNGLFDRNGELPVNPDGGLVSFGHPIDASGHNLGGFPGECVSFMSIVGTEKV
ncbi:MULTISPECIES: thiolase C-terminal domain-containing protein [Rhodococcus]|uniref:thiolase C-terminal domain-containing protein n=1 Tax=Rhodococcus TaxID=1827 RepID=UPI0035B15BED